MQRLFKFVERNLGIISVTAIVMGVIGSYLLSSEVVVGADGTWQVVCAKELLYPLAHGVKVLWGVDSYDRPWAELTSDLQRVGYILFEIARVLGYAVFLRTMVSLLQASFLTLSAEGKVRRELRRGTDVIAIHGDSAFAAAMARDLIRAGQVVAISDPETVRALGEQSMVEAQELDIALRAPTQVIIYEDDRDALDFLEDNASAMDGDARVYIHLDSIETEGLIARHLFPFSLAKLCATLYWKRHPLYPVAGGPADGRGLRPEMPRDPVIRVVIIGDNDYAWNLLEQGLLTNIFDTRGGIRYDVIGEMRHWRLAHPGLENALAGSADEVVFHGGDWLEYRDLVLTADRVILTGRGGDNVRIASELHSEPLDALHIRVDNASSLRVVGDRERTDIGPREAIVFGTNDELCTAAIIMQDRMHVHGKLRDIVYGLGTPRCNDCPHFDFGGIAAVPDDWNISDEERELIRTRRIERMEAGSCLERCLACERFRDEWGAYDSFTRRTNYAVAAHDGQKFRLLRNLGVPVRYGMGIVEGSRAYMALPPETRDALQEIEHIRWCRFSYLNGWTYAPGRKDKRVRTHPDLVPYDELTGDKSKDADAYLTLGLMIRSEEEQAELEGIWLDRQ